MKDFTSWSSQRPHQPVSAGWLRNMWVQWPWSRMNTYLIRRILRVDVGSWVMHGIIADLLIFWRYYCVVSGVLSTISLRRLTRLCGWEPVISTKLSQVRKQGMWWETSAPATLPGACKPKGRPIGCKSRRSPEMGFAKNTNTRGKDNSSVRRTMKTCDSLIICCKMKVSAVKLERDCLMPWEN